MTKLIGLDHLRALAITLVLFFHYGRLFPHPAWVQTISKFGWTGVDLFFVLSGYLISTQLFRQIEKHNEVNLKEFYIKRIFRIFPAYFLVLGIYFMFPASHEREALAPFWKYATFTQNLGLDLRSQATFSHAWSLCIEEQFYLILPICLFIFLSLKAYNQLIWLFIGLFTFGFLFRLGVYHQLIEPVLNEDGAWAVWYKWIYYPSPCRLDGLLTGVGIAALLQYRPIFAKRLMQNGNLLFATGLIILTASYFICENQESFYASVFGFPILSFGYGFLVISAISPSSFLYKGYSKLTKKLAIFSYLIYLTHKIVIHMVQIQVSKINIANDSNLMFAICMLACFISALILNLCLEKPFLKLRNKILLKINKSTTT